MPEESSHAVVIGSSIGGLVAANVLRQHFSKITLVDRDHLPDGPFARRGVPQGGQLHGLLARGREALDEMFPGLGEELVQAGAPVGDMQSDLHWYLDGRLLKPEPSGLAVLGVSRLFLEFALRRRVAAWSGVSFLGGHDVTSLTTTEDRSLITGVRVASRSSRAAEGVLEADIVVDAGGRGTRTPLWLKELGYEGPPVEKIKADLHYVSALYPRRSGDLSGRIGTTFASYPGQLRFGMILAQEGDRFIVGLGGMAQEKPPTRSEDFAAYADTFAAPDIADLVRSRPALGEPEAMHYPVSERRHYERLDAFPRGYLVFGDALCNFNPFYGQGMTVVALEGLALREALRGGRDALSRRFFEAAAQLIDGPWQMGRTGDLRFSHVTGERPEAFAEIDAYMSRYRAATVADAEIGAALLRVSNMVDDLTALTAPHLRERVLRNGPAPA